MTPFIAPPERGHAERADPQFRWKAEKLADKFKKAGLSTMAANALGCEAVHRRFETLRELAELPDSDLFRIPCFGRKSLKEFRLLTLATDDDAPTGNVSDDIRAIIRAEVCIAMRELVAGMAKAFPNDPETKVG